MTNSFVVTTERLVHLLANCRFLPGSWDKRFVAQMETWVNKCDPKKPFAPSEKQTAQLHRIAWAKRKQLRLQGFDPPLSWKQELPPSIDLEEERLLAAWRKSVLGEPGDYKDD